ncbi:WD repeat-containing protein 19, partial [Kappamyces sp. JEL0680]
MKQLEWSCHGSYLAVLLKSNDILLWEPVKGMTLVETGMKGLEFMVWSMEDELISLSNRDGDTISQAIIKGDPSLLHWSVEGKIEKLAVVLGKKSILVFPQGDLDNPFELAMNSRYGAITNSFWYNAGASLLLGFATGFVVAVSADSASMGQELYQAKIYKSYLTDISVSTSVKRCVSCGDNLIKVQDLSNLQ